MEVTGAVNPHIDAVRSAFDRWRIPYATGTPDGSLKKFWKVDIKYMDAAKAAWKLEEDARLARAAKKEAKANKTNGQNFINAVAPDNEGFTLMQRMANVEQELRTLRETVENFIKRF
jgi:hypothetical protein